MMLSHLSHDVEIGFGGTPACNIDPSITIMKHDRFQSSSPADSFVPRHRTNSDFFNSLLAWELIFDARGTCQPVWQGAPSGDNSGLAPSIDLAAE